MNLIELTTIPSAEIPVRAFADHLKLGSGFADDGSQDDLLEGYLRAAMAAIEGRIGKALLTRDFAWDVTRWYMPERQGLPLAPVSAVTAVTVLSAQGEETLVDPAAYRLREDLFRPAVVATCLPHIPVGGFARITFTAGFGAAWADVPADLAQAVFLLAASNYEARAAEHGKHGSMPFGVLSLIERYKTVRLLGDAL